MSNSEITKNAFNELDKMRDDELISFLEKNDVPVIVKTRPVLIQKAVVALFNGVVPSEPTLMDELKNKYNTLN